jgi:hypothetical protein
MLGVGGDDLLPVEQFLFKGWIGKSGSHGGEEFQYLDQLNDSFDEIRYI